MGSPPYPCMMQNSILLELPTNEQYKTPLQNDRRIHLRYTHQVPLSGKGFNMEYRAAYVIDIMKQRMPPEYYDHRTARFTSEVENDVLDFSLYKYFME